MSKKIFSPLARFYRTRLVLTGLLLLIIGAITVTPGRAIAGDPGSIREVQCPTQDPMHTPVWRNFQALVDQEYTSGPAGKRLSGEALALAYGHALGRAALAQGDDRVRQEAVACLLFVLDQKYAGILVAYGPTAEPRRRHLYDLVQSTAMGLNDELVAKHTGVTSRTPAYSVFGAAPPWQPPQKPVADGQHCATITAGAGWQAVSIPRGFNGIIQIEGSWNVHHAHATVGPEGYSGSLGDRMDRQYPHAKYHRGLPFAALLMRNGSHGPVSWVRVRKHMGIATGPDFQFRINEQDDALADNKGALTVCMSVGQHGLSSGASSASDTVSPAEWKKLVDACEKGVSGPFSVANARRLVGQADAALGSLPRECYDTEDYLACKRVNDILFSAVDQLTQVLMVSRSSAGRGCRYCDISQHGYARIGDDVDRIARELYRRGLRTALADNHRWHYATLEGEDVCKQPPPRPALSISPVARDDCPKHCADAAPACNFAYYVARTQTCSWKDDQTTPNWAALDTSDIWDRAKRVWLTRAGLELGTNRPGMDYRSFLLPQAKPALCKEACEADSRCKAWTYVNPGLQHPDQAKCWLKHGVPAPVPSPCCISGKPEVKTGFFVAKAEGNGWRKGPNDSGLKVDGHVKFIIKFDDKVKQPQWYQFYLALPAGYDVQSHFRKMQEDARAQSVKNCAAPAPMCPCRPDPYIWTRGPTYSIEAGPFPTYEEARAAHGDPSVPNGKPGSNKQWRHDWNHHLKEVENDCRKLGFSK